MQMNWYEQFFHGLALEFWRNAVSAEQTAADVDFIEGELGLTIASRTGHPMRQRPPWCISRCRFSVSSSLMPCSGRCPSISRAALRGPLQA